VLSTSQPRGNGHLLFRASYPTLCILYCNRGFQPSSGECSLTRDLIDNIPPHAILSHSWGDDSEEVASYDFVRGIGKSKAGYKKIQFCQEQAARDGIRYV
jgi:hypothetical protein